LEKKKDGKLFILSYGVQNLIFAEIYEMDGVGYTHFSYKRNEEITTESQISPLIPFL
jgi:hypothetical protein